MNYVYLIVSERDYSWYVGSTNNLKRRIIEHNRGDSRYTNQHRPYKLVYHEAYLNRMDAEGREKYFKSGPGRARLKEQLKNHFK
jgi:putative endonuclease